MSVMVYMDTLIAIEPGFNHTLAVPPKPDATGNNLAAE